MLSTGNIQLDTAVCSSESYVNYFQTTELLNATSLDEKYESVKSRLQVLCYMFKRYTRKKKLSVLKYSFTRVYAFFFF